jgi:hypothetical protein
MLKVDYCERAHNLAGSGSVGVLAVAAALSKSGLELEHTVHFVRCLQCDISFAVLKTGSSVGLLDGRCHTQL